MEKHKCNIVWVPHRQNIVLGNEKYLLLVDVKTRIPEDAGFTLDKFEYQGKIIIVCIYIYSTFLMINTSESFARFKYHYDLWTFYLHGD